MNAAYVRALQTLKNLLPSEAQARFAIYEARLLENLHRELYGTTETTRADRSMIIDELNRLAHDYGVKSFNELCFYPQTTKEHTISSYLPEPTTNIASVEGTKQRKFGQNDITPPKVVTTLLTHIIPTAYYHHLDVNRFPLVIVKIDNTGMDCDDVSLSVSTFIEDYSDTARTSIKVAKGESKETALLPLLKPASVKTLNETRRATLSVIIRQNTPTDTTLDEHTEHIRFHARDTALLGVTEANGSIRDLTNFLAAWVTPRHPEIEKVLRRATDYHSDKEFGGYQEGNTFSDVGDNVREQARAIFQALKRDIGLRYIDSTLDLGATENQITQRVRLPSQCLESGTANCIDGAVLFASLLELASIKPLLILVPGHAFVGWYINPLMKQYEFLETTLISNGEFDEAQQVAQESFDEAMALGSFDKPLFSSSGFARLIDVAMEREEGIFPLE